MVDHAGGPSTHECASNTILLERANQHAETATMRYYVHYFNLNIIRWCTQWHAGQNSNNKYSQTLLNATCDTWLNEVKVQARGQHAHHAERHGSNLRVGMHLAEEQCKRENVVTAVTM